MKISTWERWAALTGLAAAALLVLANLVQGSMPASDAPAKNLVAFFTSHHNGVLVAMFIRLFAGFAFIWFLGTLRSALSRAEGGTGRLSNVAFGAGLVVLFASGSTTALMASAAYRYKDLDPAVVAATVGAIQMFYVISGMGTAWMQLASFVVNLRTNLFPDWVGWLGVGLAVISLVLPMLAFGKPIVLYAALLSLIWISIVSVLLYRQPELAGAALNTKKSN